MNQIRNKIRLSDIKSKYSGTVLLFIIILRILVKMIKTHAFNKI